MLKPAHLLATALCLLPGPAAADEFRGKVLSVLEGDLVSVTREGKAVKLRLIDADCPEATQPFGDRATAQTSKLVLGKPVTVSGFTDVKGQLVGKVSFEKIEVIEIMRGDRIEERRTKIRADLDEELIGAGLAWAVQGQPIKDEKLIRLEQEARADRRGLWAEAGPVAPWDWRQGKRLAGPAGKPQLKIVNGSGATTVVDLTEDRQALSCQAKRGDRWEPCTLLQPFCMASCAEKGCPECAKPRPHLVSLAAGKSVEVPWSGRLYRIRPFDHRNGPNVFKCHCYEAYDPPPGRYKIGLCLEPRGRGGPRKCFDTQVDLPARLPIEIAITR